MSNIGLFNPAQLESVRRTVERLQRYEIPPLVHVHQDLPRPRVGDIGDEVGAKMAVCFPDNGSVEKNRAWLHGKTIGITAGSRGIDNIARITKAVCDWLKSRGANVFIFPAMGSHAGATPEGQMATLRHKGISPETMEVPFRSQMETRVIAQAQEFPVHVAEAVLQDCDGVVVVNRIKPHTDATGRLQSGLCKMMAVGIGKQQGAEHLHRSVAEGGGEGLSRSVELIAEQIYKSGLVVAGLGIMENGYHETAKLHAFPGSWEWDDFRDREIALLRQAEETLAKLHVSVIHLLYVGMIGKNFAGTGFDAKVAGRDIFCPVKGGELLPWTPQTHWIHLSSLDPTVEGNAASFGLADSMTFRLAAEVDLGTTMMNCVTAGTPLGSKMPNLFPDDRTAMSIMLRRAPGEEGKQRVVCVPNTLQVCDMLVSEACLDDFDDKPWFSLAGQAEPARFDEHGHLVFPW